MGLISANKRSEVQLNSPEMDRICSSESSVTAILPFRHLVGKLLRTNLPPTTLVLAFGLITSGQLAHGESSAAAAVPGDPEQVGYSADSFQIGSSDYGHIEQQIDLGELREAQAELETTLSQLQRTGDRYDNQLVEPLRLLGRVFHESGDYPRAAETLALATQISRVANGLHSAEQLHLVHQEIRSLKAMGNIVEANRRHEYAFSIARRHFGRFGEELIPELLKIGVWYTSTGDVIGARDRFSEARLLLSAKPESAESNDMLFALKGIARTYRDEAFPPFYSRPNKETAELYARNGLTDRQAGIREDLASRASLNSFHRGSEALIDIVRIEVNRLADIQEQLLSAQSAASDADANANANADADAETPAAPTKDAATTEVDRQALIKTSARRRTTTVSLEELKPVISSPEADKQPFIDSLLALGDWYLLTNKETRAFGYYQHAYRVAAQDPNTDPEALFGSPTLLYFPRPRDPRTPDSAPRESFEQGLVELMYDVDHRGAIKRLRTLQSQPKGLMDFNVRSSARVARYRPRIVDGLPQPTTEQTYRHTFDYFPRGQQTSPPKVINTDAAENSGQTGSGH